MHLYPGAKRQKFLSALSLTFPEPSSFLFLEGGVQQRGVSAADPSPEASGLPSRFDTRGRRVRSCSAKAQALARVQKST